VSESDFPGKQDEQLDEQLKELFQSLNRPLSDQAFVDIVMRRLSRRARARRVTLTAASVAGFAVSAGPLYRLINRLSEGLAFAVSHWAEFAPVPDIQLFSVIVLVAIASPAALRWLSR
jgi:hypothetical protein